MTAHRAPVYANLARANGWEVEVEEVNNVVDTSYDGGLVASAPEASHVDLSISTTWRHPDTGAGWELALAIRWYANHDRRGRTTWRLAALDGHNGRTVAGVARRLEDGRELELWLGGLKVLEQYIKDPADLVAWLDEQAAQEVEQ